MPNWCDNAVTISHKNKRKIKKLVTAYKRGRFFATIYPEPDYSVTPVKKTYPEISAQYAKTEEEKAQAYMPTINPSNWWDWRVQHWGTKWEIETKGYDINISDHEISFSFSSAWSPPVGIYQKLAEQGFEVEATYYESGCAFCGYWTNDLEDCYDIENDYEWVRKNIPRNIDEEYGISESIKEYKLDDLLDTIHNIEEQLKTATDTEKAELEAELIKTKQEYEELEESF